jgi:hypothetical protein
MPARAEQMPETSFTSGAPRLTVAAHEASALPQAPNLLAKENKR